MFEKSDKVYSVVPLPHGVRCLLCIQAESAVIITHKSVAREIGRSCLPADSLFEGYLCLWNDSVVFVLVDAFIVGGEDIRKQEYSARLAMARNIDFKFEFEVMVLT
jgi:hypothetical protein